MRSVKKSIFAGALLALICGTTGAPAQTLKVWGPEQISDPLTRDLWDKMDAAFEAKSLEVQVEQMQPTGTIGNGAVQAAIQSGVGPDVLVANPGVGRIDIGYNPSVYLPGKSIDVYYQVIQGLIAGQVGPDEGIQLLQSAQSRAK